MIKYDFSTYISPFTWRYGSKEMRYIFSEQHKYELWRKIWLALAEAQQKAGLISKEELEDLIKHEKNINIERILEIEKEITVDEGEQIKLQPKVSDPDNDKVTIKYSGWMNSATYTTTYEDAGVYTVTVTVSDGKKEVSQNIKVIVNDMNRPPVIESITLE